MSAFSTPSLLCDLDCYNQTLALNASISARAYSPDIIPSTATGQPLVVYVLFALAKLISLDNSGILNVAGVMGITWRDGGLTWNASEYGGLRSFQAVPDNVWTPTLTLLNPASNNVSFPINTQPIWVVPDGTSVGFVVSQFTTACSMDLIYFPFDTQTCSLEFTDINYFTNLISYQPSYPNVSLSFYSPSKSWSIVSSTVTNSTAVISATTFSQRYFATLVISFTLQRTAVFYVIVLIFPTILLEIMLFFVFFLPHGSQVKVTLSASLVLTIYVLQKYSANLLPSFAADEAPQIIWGLCSAMILGGVTLLSSVLSVTIHQLHFTAPQWMRTCLCTNKSKLNKQETPSTKQLDLVNGTGPNPENNASESQSDDVSKVIASTSDGEASENDVALHYLEEFVKLKRKKFLETKRRKVIEEEQKINSLTWQRAELVFNILIATGYITYSIFYTTQYLFP